MFASVQVVGAKVGEKLTVGCAEVGVSVGDAEVGSCVGRTPPPHEQHMSFEEKSESSRAPHQEAA